MKRRKIIILTIISGLLSASGGILGNIAASTPLPPIIIPYLRFAWLAFAAVTLLGIILAVWQIPQEEGTDRPRQTQERQNRQRMLERVRATWIKGVLEQSLQGAALIVLGLTEQPDAVANPRHRVLQQPDQSPHPLPFGTPITRIYDDAGGELLILGEPGSGKTTLLLELARDLLDRAKNNDTHPIPVVFNLSSWSVKRMPLKDWLVEELNTSYQVPRKVGQSWIDNDQILLLLDGLDEVALTHRAACIDTINTFRRGHMVSAVVCSRAADYFAQEQRVQLHAAVVVQPLTVQQIEGYLANAGTHFAKLRLVLGKDLVLQELTATPLMLSVLTQAYHKIPFEDLLKAGTLDTRRKKVFATYVEQMLQRRNSDTHYTVQQTTQWLAWLAKQLVQHNQTEFYIERMQPNWLTDPRSHQFYSKMVSNTISRIFVRFLENKEIKPAEVITWSWSRVLKQSLKGFVTITLFTAPLGGLIALLAGLILGRFIKGSAGLVASVGLLGSFLLLFLGRLSIRGVVRLLFKLSSIADEHKIMPPGGNCLFFIVIYLGVFIGFFGELNSGLTWLFNISFSVLIIVLFIGVGIGLSYGVSSELLDDSNLAKPNQGIWLSMRNGMLVGLGCGLFAGLLEGLFWALSYGLRYGIITGLLTWMLVWLLVGLKNGGTESIKHVTVRLLLWHAGYTPLNYPRFLDYATDCILLRKIGGGYIFIHRLLQDYFVSLEPEPTRQ